MPERPRGSTSGKHLVQTEAGTQQTPEVCLQENLKQRVTDMFEQTFPREDLALKSSTLDMNFKTV